MYPIILRQLHTCPHGLLSSLEHELVVMGTTLRGRAELNLTRATDERLGRAIPVLYLQKSTLNPKPYVEVDG